MNLFAWLRRVQLSARPSNDDAAFDGTDEQWFEQDLARLDRDTPNWNHAGRVMSARRWWRKNPDPHLLQALFGVDVTREAMVLEGAIDSRAEPSRS